NASAPRLHRLCTRCVDCASPLSMVIRTPLPTGYVSRERWQRCSPTSRPPTTEPGSRRSACSCARPQRRAACQTTGIRTSSRACSWRPWPERRSSRTPSGPANATGSSTRCGDSCSWTRSVRLTGVEEVLRNDHVASLHEPEGVAGAIVVVFHPPNVQEAIAAVERRPRQALEMGECSAEARGGFAGHPSQISSPRLGDPAGDVALFGTQHVDREGALAERA